VAEVTPTAAVEGAEKVERAGQGLDRDLLDWRHAWRAVSDEVYSIERHQFLTLGARGPNGRWKERSQAYVDRQTSINRKGFKVLNELMRRTDAMFKAVTMRGAPGGIYEETGTSLTLGTSLKSDKGFPYPAAHQTGGKRLPQRKIYDPTERDAARLASILKRGLVKKIADRGFDYVDAGEIPF